MDSMEGIYTRRSIRKYDSRNVPDDLVNEVIRAGMYAPSAGNERPWHFVVIRERRLLDEIPSFHPHSMMVKAASCAILVCADLVLEKHKGYWVQDCSAATQNMLLGAHSKGLGAVWVGVFPREERVKGFRKLLGIPEEIIPFSLIPLGYPAEKKETEERFDSSRIHRDRW